MRLIFDPSLNTNAIGFTEGEGHALPKGATSQLLLRYFLEEGQVVDRYKGLSDEEVLASILAEQTKAQADAEAAAAALKREEAARLSRVEYLRRFTQAERIEISQSADPVIKDFWTLGLAAEFISLLDPETIAGTGYLETLGLIAEGRAAQILEH